MDRPDPVNQKQMSFADSKRQGLHFCCFLLCLAVTTCGPRTALCTDDLATASARNSRPFRQNELPDSLSEARSEGLRRSRYLQQNYSATQGQAPVANIAEYEDHISPILQAACVDCHGPDTQEGNIRIDNLDPNLIQGEDVNWWLEIAAVLTNGEMPPPEEKQLKEKDRSRIIEWLTTEIQTASTVRRAERGHSSFRRLTRYEYNYALQDLLRLPFDFAADLPPEAASDDGFQNSSEMLHMSAMQFHYYRELGRKALQRATVRGEPPAPVFWSITMRDAVSKTASAFERDVQKKKEQLKDEPEKLADELQKLSRRYSGNRNAAHYLDQSTDQSYKVSWGYSGARHAFAPVDSLIPVPDVSSTVAVLPARQKMIIELGNRIPDDGTVRIRIRACRTSNDGKGIPSLHWDFGWQASNNSAASERITPKAVPILAPPEAPQFYEWNIPLSEIRLRNPMRRTAKMGATPNPSEYFRLENCSVSKADVQIDYVEIAAPVYEQWPPESHRRIFADADSTASESTRARQILELVMPKAWRRPITDEEFVRKLELFHEVRPHCRDFQEAMIEVLATVLASPNFLYVGLPASAVTSASDAEIDAATTGNDDLMQLSDFQLAARLSFFLWCSLPDDELLSIAAEGKLSEKAVLTAQVDRMLADHRSHRFSERFVRQWLGMQLLDFLSVDRKVFPQFNQDLRDAMQNETVYLFEHLLEKNGSVIDFLHADYAFVNERLAGHYGIRDVYGTEFRRVALKPDDRRGGLLTNAGLLAMNSDGKDSHPLKRGIWMLDRLLNDPPPPPPPAVPEIDLADPEIAKLTLKQRLEDHRNDAACLSCHSKIDPWGIAFENFDAIGRWRTEINGQPVDAASQLFNGQTLEGMDGLKRFLLTNRQDQFVRALTHKTLTFGLGRPLTFADHSSVDRIAAELRREGDGLKTLIRLIVASDLFISK